MKAESLLHRASRSYIGNVAIFEVAVALPLAVMFEVLSYSDGELTTGRVIEIALVCFVFIFVAATLFWFTVSLPLLRRRKNGD